MNKIASSLLLLLSFYIAKAQVQISTIKDNFNADGENHSFPLIHSTNPKIAYNINRYLQLEILDNPAILTNPRKIFEKSKYIYTDSIHQSGYSMIQYKVKMNTPRILSLLFELESTGAYSAYYTKYYSFNIQTGELIAAKNLFTAEGLNYLRKYLIKEREKRIAKFIQQEYPHFKDSTYLKETYAECNQHADEDKILILPGSIIFYKEYCFPHAGRPYDTDLDIKCNCKQLERYLSDFGRKLLL